MARWEREGKAGPRHAMARRRCWRMPAGIAAGIVLLAGAGGLLLSPAADASLTGTVHGTGSLAFPTVPVGTSSGPKTATVEWTGTVTVSATAATYNAHITGTDATEFDVTSVTCTKVSPPATYCQIAVTFTPSTTPSKVKVGLQTATLVVPGNYANYPFHIALSGVDGYRAIHVAPSPVTFGTVQDTTSAAATVTVTNTGNESLKLKGTTGISGSTAFTVVRNTCGSKTLLPSEGNSCTIGVDFSPASGASGLQSAALTVDVKPADSATTFGTNSAALHGTASNTPPEVTVSPLTENFGEVPVGTTATSGVVTVVNHGSVATDVTVSTATGTGFAVVNDGATNACNTTPTTTTIPPGTSCTFKVQFAPTTAGAESGSVTVSGSFGSQSVSLAGTGTQAAATVETSSGGATLNFGSEPEGLTKTGWIKITNTGNAALDFTATSMLFTTGTPTPAVYVDTDGCEGQSIQPTQTCTVFVTFTPRAIGPAPSASYQIFDNATPDVVTVPLVGTGANPLSATLSVSQVPAAPSGTPPGVIGFGSIGVGRTATVAATLTNQGSAPADITKVALVDQSTNTTFGGNNTTIATCKGQTLLAAPGVPDSCTITLTFSPSVPGQPERALLNVTFKTTSGQLTRKITEHFPVEGVGFGITTTGLPTGTVGVPYETTLAAAGGTKPYSWSRYSGTLPPGLTLNAKTGELSGTPTAQGAYSFKIQVTEANGQFNRKQFTIDVFPPPLVVAPNSLATAVVGRPYTASVVTASGGTPPYTYYEWSCIRITPPYTPGKTTGKTTGACTVTGAAQGVPPGMTFNPNTGVLAGTPSQQGRFELRVRVTDHSTYPSAQVQTVTTYLSIVPTTLGPVAVTLPQAAVGTAYSAKFGAMNGTPPYTFSGASVDGLSVSTTTSTSDHVGKLSGTPVNPGTFHDLVTITDSSYYPTPPKTQTATETLTIVVKPKPLAFGTANLPSGQVGMAYTGTVTVTSGKPGTAPYVFSVYSGALPPGLSLSTTTSEGKITGTPTKAGTYTFGVEVTDSSPPAQHAYASYTITVAAVPSLTVSGTLPGGQVNVSYTGTVKASGGAKPYAFAVTSGSLPSGLVLTRTTSPKTTTATISGTPTSAGTYHFTITATDSSSPQRSGSTAFTITITPPAALALAATPSSSQTCTVGTTCSVQFTASGGSGTGYQYFKSGGSFPPGMTLTATTGLLKGKPTKAGSHTFTVEVEDSAHHLAHLSYKITVAA